MKDYEREGDGKPVRDGRSARFHAADRTTGVHAGLCAANDDRGGEGLSTPKLDHLHDPRSNTIGGLLAHIAAVEVAYQLATFEGRGFTPDEEETAWRAALDLGQRARREICDYDLAYYLGMLETVRAKTLRELARRDDRWLDEETPFWDGLPANNYFKWFDVFEDEVNHPGQIRWLRKRLPPTQWA